MQCQAYLSIPNSSLLTLLVCCQPYICTRHYRTSKKVPICDTKTRAYFEQIKSCSYSKVINDLKQEFFYLPW